MLWNWSESVLSTKHRHACCLSFRFALILFGISRFKHNTTNMRRKKNRQNWLWAKFVCVNDAFQSMSPFFRSSSSFTLSHILIRDDRDKSQVVTLLATDCFVTLPFNIYYEIVDNKNDERRKFFCQNSIESQAHFIFSAERIKLRESHISLTEFGVRAENFPFAIYFFIATFCRWFFF